MRFSVKANLVPSFILLSTIMSVKQNLPIPTKSNQEKKVQEIVSALFYCYVTKLNGARERNNHPLKTLRIVAVLLFSSLNDVKQYNYTRMNLYTPARLRRMLQSSAVSDDNARRIVFSQYNDNRFRKDGGGTRDPCCEGSEALKIL